MKGCDKVDDFEKLYRDYFETINLFLVSLCNNPDLALELTQETFFKALRSVNKFRGECDIKVWLCQIAKNTYYTYCKKRKKLISTDDEDSSQFRNDVSFIDSLDDTETCDRLHEIIHSLNEPYKEVFSLRVFGELSFAKIGKLFGKTDNWACVTYHRAKRIIQKRMEDDYE